MSGYVGDLITERSHGARSLGGAWVKSTIRDRVGSDPSSRHDIGVKGTLVHLFGGRLGPCESDLRRVARLESEHWLGQLEIKWSCRCVCIGAEAGFGTLR
jgi:hypothetical protein